MAKAIVTTYFGPTNTRGSRIIAKAEGVKPLSVGYQSALDSDENHTAAAMQLCAKYGWSGELIRAGLPNGNTVFVFAGKPEANLVALVRQEMGTILSGLRELQGNHEEGDEHHAAIDRLSSDLVKFAG